MATNAPALEVGLVDDEDVRDLQDAGLDHLHAVAQVGREHDHGGVGDGRDLELGLPHPDRLQDHGVEAERAQQPDRLARGQREAAEVSAGAHAADEDLRVQGVALHADAVTQDRPARERRVGVGGDHRHRSILLAQVRDQRIDQRRLAGSGRAGEPHDVGLAHAITELLLKRPHSRIAALDHGDRAGEGANVPGPKPVR